MTKIKNKVYKFDDEHTDQINDFITDHNVIRTHGYNKNYEAYLKIYYKEQEK